MTRNFADWSTPVDDYRVNWLQRAATAKTSVGADYYRALTLLQRVMLRRNTPGVGDVMRVVNWRGVILCGLLAGMIIDVFEFVLNGVVFAKHWEAAILALGRRPTTTPSARVF